MTAIAYRDGVMAADTGTFGGSGTIVNATAIKIWQSPDGSLLGCCGAAHHCEDFREWAMAGFDSRAYPRGMKDIGALVVRADGRMFFYFDRPTPTAHDAPWAAIGACEDLLFGALAQGATAEESIRIAIKYHSDAAGDVYSLRLPAVVAKAA